MIANVGGKPPGLLLSIARVRDPRGKTREWVTLGAEDICVGPGFLGEQVVVSPGSRGGSGERSLATRGVYSPGGVKGFHGARNWGRGSSAHISIIFGWE